LNTFNAIVNATPQNALIAKNYVIAVALLTLASTAIQTVFYRALTNIGSRIKGETILALDAGKVIRRASSAVGYST